MCGMLSSRVQNVAELEVLPEARKFYSERKTEKYHSSGMSIACYYSSVANHEPLPGCQRLWDLDGVGN